MFVALLRSCRPGPASACWRALPHRLHEERIHGAHRREVALEDMRELRVGNQRGLLRRSATGHFLLRFRLRCLQDEHDQGGDGPGADAQQFVLEQVELGLGGGVRPVVDDRGRLHLLLGDDLLQDRGAVGRVGLRHRGGVGEIRVCINKAWW